MGMGFQNLVRGLGYESSEKIQDSDWRVDFDSVGIVGCE